MMYQNNKKRRLIEMPGIKYPQRGLFPSYIEEETGKKLPGSGNGFTLIEVIVVVVIISIVALAAVPMMSSASSVQIRSAASMIAADLEYAKSMAISRGQNYSVLFEIDADSYRLRDQDTNVIGHPVKKGFDYIVDFQNDDRLSRVDITSADFNGTPDVEFDSLGSPDSGGDVTLQAGGTTIMITVEPITGYISVN
jgi:type II secretion system protein H